MGAYEETFRGLKKPSSGGMSSRLVRRQPPGIWHGGSWVVTGSLGGLMRQVVGQEESGLRSQR
jgi:hypothetical protein